MKTKYLIPLSMIVGASVFGADAIEVSSSGGNWSSGSTWVSPAGTVPTNSSSSDPYASIKFNGGKLVLDANAESQYVNLITSSTASELEIVAGKTFTVTPVLVGDKVFIFENGSKTNLTVSGEGTFVINTISGDNRLWTGSVLTLNAASKITGGGQLTTDGTLVVNKTMTTSHKLIMSGANAVSIFNANANFVRINAYGGGDITVAKGVTLSVKEDIYTKAGGKTVVNGTLNVNTSGKGTNAQYDSTGYGDMTIGAASSGTKVTIASGAVMNVGAKGSVTNNVGLNNKGIIEIQGTLNVANTLKMFNGSTLILNGGKLNSSVYSSTGKNAEADYKSDFLIAGYTASKTTKTYNTGNTNVSLQVKKSATLGTIYMTDMTGVTIGGTEVGSTSLIIDFTGAEKGTTLVVDDILGILDSESLSFSRTLSLKSYIDGMLKVNTMLETNEDGSLVGMFTYDAQKLYQLADGTISLTQIPEPSTYAIIFGMLALGFVAYRKRR